MSALARYFHRSGWNVSGYDRTPTALTDELQREGITVHFDDDVKLIPADVLSAEKESVRVIYTPAIPADHAELNFFKNEGYRIQKRSEVLGELSQAENCVAVAGTHGKTTTSTLIAHILHASKKHVNAFLGGISTNYHTNLLLDEKAVYTVVEADEFDRSFLKLDPYLAVITSMDADHLDIYGDAAAMHESYQLFADKIVDGGTLIHRFGLPLKTERKRYTYSITDHSADYFADDIRVVNANYQYTVKYPGGSLNEVRSGLPGRHNVENALAAFAAAHQLGVDPKNIAAAIASYQGVKRRFEYIVKRDDLVFIDDYAHHPEELRACIESAREMYPQKKITGVFQPHLYTRTRDFADGFAKSLSLLDEVFLLDIYPARELPIKGVTSTMLLERMRSMPKHLVSKTELNASVKNVHPEVLLTLGAGDIDKLVEPLKHVLS